MEKVEKWSYTILKIIQNDAYCFLTSFITIITGMYSFTFILFDVMIVLFEKELGFL